MAIHPTTRILIGLSLIVASSALSVIALTVTTLLLALAAVVCRDITAWRWVKRARWLLIVPILINGYFVAGDAVIVVLDAWSPTWQGLQLGALQSLRLLLALLGLRSILRPMSREQMALGFATLLTPLGFLGVDIARLVRRLELTMAYLETLDGKVAAAVLRGKMPAQFVAYACPQKHVAIRMGGWDLAFIALTGIALLRVLQ